MSQDFLAHIDVDKREQSLYDHLLQTAQLAASFAKDFNNEKSAFLCGIYHDIGKYSKAFQRRIQDGSPESAPHAASGAIELNKRYANIGKLLAYCVAGHHTGLPDGGSLADTEEDATLNGTLKRVPDPYQSYLSEFPEVDPPQIKIRPFNRQTQGFTLSFYIRMLFSCLVDADFLDTAEFMNGITRDFQYDDINTLNDQLIKKLKTFQAPESELNRKRNEILYTCLNKAKSPKGVYTMTVPTGGGKTLTSTAFALAHAEKHGMERVIYVIPYNSIIEQNANVLKDILGEKNVLEHHTGFHYDADNALHQQFKLASENWDAPVVVTTSVQFYESLFASRTSKCRKLHNIANSVIVLDEAQLLPTKYLMPCIQVLSELVQNYQCTVLLTSATQPALKERFPLEMRELSNPETMTADVFKRTEFKSLGDLEDEALTERLKEHHQVLCIVNTKKQAQQLFLMLRGQDVFHLSTYMTPAHRKAVLDEIRERLETDKRCLVISTSLIEAGVDVDFPVVYRAKAGLDSMVQAAGRCNREGKREICPVYIFDPSMIYKNNLLSFQRRPIQVADIIQKRFEDIGSPQAIETYFKELYNFEGEGLDIENILEQFNASSFDFPFRTVAKLFKLIDQNTHTIIVPIKGEAVAMAVRLKRGERNRDLMRSIQPYTVNVYDQVYRVLKNYGAIEILDEEIAILRDMRFYDDRMGLDISVGGGAAVFV